MIHSPKQVVIEVVREPSQLVFKRHVKTMKSVNDVTWGLNRFFLVLYLPSHIILNQEICNRTNEFSPNSPI